MTAFPALPLLAGDDWGRPWWPLWLLFWALLVGAVVWLLARRRDRDGDPRSRARELLAERYARGEIDGEEYRERLAELRRDLAGA